MLCPFTNAPVFETNNIAAPAISSGWPTRRIRERDLVFRSVSGSSHSTLALSVLIGLGAIAIHTKIMIAVFDHEIARQLQLRHLRDTTGADRGRAFFSRRP